MPCFSITAVTFEQTRSAIRKFLTDPMKTTIFNGALNGVPDILLFIEFDLVEDKVCLKRLSQGGCKSRNIYTISYAVIVIRYKICLTFK